MTPRTFSTSLTHATARVLPSVGVVESRETPDGLRTSGVSREGLLAVCVLNAWSERVANGEMSAADYAAKARALATRTA